jgi:hypothetical protein
MSMVLSPNISSSMPADLPFPSRQEWLRFSRDHVDGTRLADDVLPKAGRTPRNSTRHLQGRGVSGSEPDGASLLDACLDGDNSSLPVPAPKDTSPSLPPNLPRPASGVPKPEIQEKLWLWASCGAMLASATPWLTKGLLLVISSAGCASSTPLHGHFQRFCFRLATRKSQLFSRHAWGAARLHSEPCATCIAARRDHPKH